MNKLAAIIGLLAGCSLLLYWGGEAPPWLLKLEILAVSCAALAFGFTAYSPVAPEWMRHDSVRGVALVYLGVGAMFVPLNFLASAFLIGTGARLVMQSTITVTARVTGVSIGRSTGDIVLRRSGDIAPRD
jgi:hypothetical protein